MLLCANAVERLALFVRWIFRLFPEFTLTKNASLAVFVLVFPGHVCFSKVDTGRWNYWHGARVFFSLFDPWPPKLFYQVAHPSQLARV